MFEQDQERQEYTSSTEDEHEEAPTQHTANDSTNINCRQQYQFRLGVVVFGGKKSVFISVGGFKAVVAKIVEREVIN